MPFYITDANNNSTVVLQISDFKSRLFANFGKEAWLSSRLSKIDNFHIRSHFENLVEFSFHGFTICFCIMSYLHTSKGLCLTYSMIVYQYRFWIMASFKLHWCRKRFLSVINQRSIDCPHCISWFFVTQIYTSLILTIIPLQIRGSLWVGWMLFFY